MDAMEIAKSYGEALFELGKEQGVLDTLEEELNSFRKLCEEEEQIRLFLEAPHIRTDEKKEILKKALSDKATKAFQNFLFVVLDKSRFRIFSQICDSFRTLMDEEEGRIRAKAFTAREIGDDVLKKISDTLEKKTNQKVILEHKVKPDLLGGIVLKVGETQIDGSLRNQLKEWKKNLMEKKYEV